MYMYVNLIKLVFAVFAGQFSPDIIAELTVP